MSARLYNRSMRVFIIAAVTADGFIARDSDHMADWTEKEDKQLYVKLTKESGVMVMGSRTFDTIGRALPGRKTIVYTSRPEKYQGIENVEATTEPPEDLIKRLGNEGYDSIAICGGAKIYTLFMQAGLVTDLYLTFAPVIFGTGIQLFQESLDITLQLKSLEKLGEHSIAAHYAVVD
jgi:dihydrofolate reductase